MSTINFTVTVSSGKFVIDGATAPKLTFRDGDTYVFDQADSSNSGHILQFSATANNSGSSEYTTGVTKSGTPGTDGKTTIITSGSTTDTLYYYSSGGGDHGAEFSNSGFNTSTNYSFLKPIIGGPNTAEKWGSMVNHAIDQIDQNISGQDLDGATDSGTVAVDLDTQSLTVAGSNGIATSGSGQTITVSGEALAYQGEPHIIPGVLYPAVAGKLLDGSTSHSGNYGTAQADGYSYYYTDIKGSKPIKDPRIGGHFGSQRHKIRSPQLLEQETATHGYNCYSVDGREWMRISGTATTDIEEKYYGSGHMIALKNATDFIEATGYFSDVNIIMETHGNYDSWTKQLNGATASAGQSTVTADSPLTNRYVDSGSVLNLGLSATLGINTVRINAGADIYLSGIELIAQDTSSDANKSKIQIPSQNVVSYGKKFTVSGTPHYDPFNGFTNSSDLHSAYVDTATSLGLSSAPGSSASWAISSTNNIRPYNGMRVVKWVDSSGTIKTSVTAMPPNAQNIAENVLGTTEVTTPSATNATFTPIFSDDAIDHSLSEVAKTFNFNEFGNGAANGGTGATYADASMLSSADDIAYVMDDGLTSLSGKAVSRTGNKDLIGDNDDGSSPYYVTFIGTGISVMNTADTAKNVTWFQNLPYGTHIVKVDREGGTAPDIDIDGVEMNDNASVNNYGEMHDVTFYQPKKPPIPEDAVVLADYMLMADFVAQSSAGIQYISKGIRSVSCSRDMFINGSGLSMSLNLRPDHASHGFRMHDGNDSGNLTCRLPSFCTNFVLNGYQSDSHHHLNLDGTDNDSSATKDNTAGYGSYAHLTSDVTLGVHTVGFNAASSKNGNFSNIDVASPIHTSSHYQTFETPYLHELVGGDRNMEQHNLVVTPDGKTWDEVTRDTSYIGNACVTTGTTTGSTSGSTFQIFDEWRGSGGSGGAYKPFLNKDFAIAYDRIICLIDGWYEIHSQSLRKGTITHCHIKINGVTIQYAHGGSSDHDTPSNTVKVFLKRGDYIQNQGGWFQSLDYALFQISRM